MPITDTPDCVECIYYYITHEVGFPYGCRALGFKSKRKPQDEVLEASGKLCLVFEPCRKAKV